MTWCNLLNGIKYARDIIIAIKNACMNALAQLEESLLGTNDSSMSLPNEESENHVQSTHPLTFTIIIWFYFFLHFFLYIYILNFLKIQRLIVNQPNIGTIHLFDSSSKEIGTITAFKFCKVGGLSHHGCITHGVEIYLRRLGLHLFQLVSQWSK